MRGNVHVRFGGRAGETHQPKGEQGAPVRPLQRSFAKHRSITDPDHVRAAQAMRVAAANRIGIKNETDEVEVRDLSVYDRLTGVA